MNPKVKAIKIKKATELMSGAVSELQQAYLSMAEPMARNEGVTGDLLIGSCVGVNYLACQKLIDNGFNARFVGGNAAFRLNKGEHGVMVFGYTGNMDVLMPSGNEFDGVGFLGHAWVEIRNLDLIVDITLAHLKQHMIQDNAHRGIVCDEYLLSPNRVVVPRSELITKEKIISGAVGYHYAPNSSSTQQAINRWEALKGLSLETQ